MSEGQSQRSIASSTQHRWEAEVAAAEEHERAMVETAATMERAARLTMVELAAARVEVEVAAAADVARVAAAELEALRASSIGSSVSVNDDRDNKLKPARDTVVAAQMGADAMVAVAQTGADASAARLTEIVAFTGGVAPPPRTGTMVTMGSRPLSGTSVPAAGGLPSPRSTTSSGPW
jgi:hypothetical protein